MASSESNTGVSSAVTRNYPAGTVLFEENDPGSRMYVIREGKVRIFRRMGKSEIVLAELEHGDFFGEMALLENEPRSAGAEVMEDAELVEVDKTTLAEMLSRNPQIAVRMMRKLAGRIRELDERLQVLMMEGGLARAVEVLLWLSKNSATEGPATIPSSELHVTLANQAGIPTSELETVLSRLRLAKCISEKSGKVVIADMETLHEYHDFLHLKLKYDPDHFHVREAPAAADSNAQRAMSRLLHSMQIPPEDLESKQSVLREQLQRFAHMKSRFEMGGPKST